MNPNDRLTDMWIAQAEQQAELTGYIEPCSEAERIRLGMELGLGIHEEMTEYLNHLGYKSLLPSGERASDRRAARLVELSDILKYAFALAQLDGYTSQELYDAFMEKTHVVAERRKRELAQTNIAGFDIDGVIADIDAAGYDWQVGDDIKAKFFDNGGALRARSIAGAAWLLRYLHNHGWGIVLISARKTYLHSRLEAETYRWLAREDIPYDRVIFAYDKAQAINDARLPLKFFVEDSPKHALDVARSGIDVLYVGTADIEHERIIPFGDMIECGDHICERYLERKPEPWEHRGSGNVVTRVAESASGS